MCSNIGSPKIGTNRKLIVLGVPILKHFRVFGCFLFSSPVRMLAVSAWTNCYSFMLKLFKVMGKALSGDLSYT